MKNTRYIVVALVLAMTVVFSGCTAFGWMPRDVAQQTSITTSANLEAYRQQMYTHYTTKLNAIRLAFYKNYADVRARAIARLELQDVLSGDAITELDVELSKKEEEFLANLEAARVNLNANLSWFDQIILVNREARKATATVQAAYSEATAMISKEYSAAFEAASIRAMERDRYNDYMTGVNEANLEAYIASLEGEGAEELDTSVEIETGAPTAAAAARRL